MDAISARYLVSALIQATAIVYGIVMAVNLKDAFDLLKEITAIEEPNKVGLKLKIRTQLKIITGLTFLTILSGIFALGFFNETEIDSAHWACTGSGFLVILVVIFSVLTFFSLTWFAWRKVLDKGDG